MSFLIKNKSLNRYRLPDNWKLEAEVCLHGGACACTCVQKRNLTLTCFVEKQKNKTCLTPKMRRLWQRGI